MQNTIQNIKIVALAVLLSVGLNFAYAWVAPTAAPPGGNAATPLNTSNTAQTKTGALGTGALTVTGDVTLSGTGKINLNGGASQLCFGTDCKSAWPTAGASLWTQTGTHISNTNTGSVGIGMGTAAPAEKLEVAGSVLASSLKDRNDTAYYVDPSLTSIVSRLDASLINVTNLNNHKRIRAVDGSGSLPWELVGTVTSNTNNAWSSWVYTPLSTTRSVLGIRLAGNSDDGGKCAISISGNFVGIALARSTVTYVSLIGVITGGGNTSTGGGNQSFSQSWIFDNIVSGQDLSDVPTDLFSHGRAHNKAIGLTYIPPGKTVGSTLFVRGTSNITCNIYALYGN